MAAATSPVGEAARQLAWWATKPSKEGGQLPPVTVSRTLGFGKSKGEKRTQKSGSDHTVENAMGSGYHVRNKSLNLPHAPATKYVFVHIPVKKVLSKVAVLRNCDTKAMSWVRGCPTY